MTHSEILLGTKRRGPKGALDQVEDLCKPKTQGGMSFKDLARFNDALLAKQTWHLLHEKTSFFLSDFQGEVFSKQ